MDRLEKLRKRAWDENVVLQIIYIPPDRELRYPLIKEEEPADENFPPNSSNFNLMEQEEVKEKHLQDAIKYNSKIPVPEIVLIDRDTYDKLYPANFQKPKIRVISHPQDEEHEEYDIDSEDEAWLAEKSTKLNLSTKAFETYVDFLESNCGSKSIPKVDDMKSVFKRHPAAVIEDVYDYWLDKRLRGKGTKLMPQIVIGDLPQKKRIKYNPYAAFRPRVEKMRLRKNRARDCENYRQMLQLKTNLQSYRKTSQFTLEKQRLAHEMLQAKFGIFIKEYQGKQFSSLYFEHSNVSNLDFFMEDFRHRKRVGTNEQHGKEGAEDGVAQSNGSPNEFHDPYPLTQKSGNQYHKIITDDDVTDDANGHLNNSTRVRCRIGRGGRMVIDRHNNHGKLLSVYTITSTAPETVQMAHTSNLLQRGENNNVSSKRRVASSVFWLSQPKYSSDLNPNDCEFDFR